MTMVSSLYQVETTINRYNTIAYNWGDSSHPETYQSFATTGKGLIDQSIFPFQRRNDAWSLGAYCTSLALGADASQISMEVHKSTLSKNNAFVLNNLIQIQNQYGKEINDSFKYSPAPTLSGWSPWINFEYTKTRIYPTFYMIDPVGTTYGPWDYNQVVANNATTWQCWACFYEITGSVNSAFNIMNCQYAGRVREQVITSVGWDRYNITFGDVEEGVYYYINGGNQLFQGLTVMIDNNTSAGNPIPSRTLTAFFDFTQMQWEMVRMSIADAYQFTISFDDVVKMIESLGFYWCKDRDALSSEGGINCTDPDLCCPIIDPETHMVTDEVLAGSEISDYALQHIDDPFCNFLLDSGNTDGQGNPIGITTDEYRETYYPEQATVEPADEIDLNEPVIATTGGTSVWLMNQQKLEEFFTYLWNPDGTIFDDIVKGCALLGENPMDSIISCRFFPLNLADVFNSKFDSNYRTIMFGRVRSTVTARHMISSNVANYELGSFYFNDSGMFNDFRDYEPYSSYSLYLPFVGITPLAAIECIGKTISIKYIIDLITGACTAVIYTDGVPYKYLDGMIGIEIPVTGRNMAQYGQQILGAALGGGAAVGMKGSKIGESMVEPGMETSKDAFRKAGNNFANGRDARGIMHVAGGSAAAVGAQMAPAVLGAAYGIAGAGIAGAASALVNNPSPQQAGSNVPAMGLAKPLFAYFIVERSDSWIPENYAKLHGRPLQQGGKVKDFSGFSTFSNIKLENIGVATSEEKTLISKILASGVYI